MIPLQHVLPLLLAISMQFSLSACERSPAETASVSPAPPAQTQELPEDSQGPSSPPQEEEEVTAGTEWYRGFRLDNVLHSETEGDIHYHIYLPDDYDGSSPYALYLTLPGYEGLYFQGVGENLYREDFAFQALNYNSRMIVAAPQLNDWGETSARQTIALTEYLLDHYNIDRNQVYANGYSGGGETMSQVMGLRPDLFTAYLHCSSQWDGAYEPVVESRTPVYLVVGAEDEYYGSQPTQRAYDQLYALYAAEGLSPEEIQSLLVLDIKDADYFSAGAPRTSTAGAICSHRTPISWAGCFKPDQQDLTVNRSGRGAPGGCRSDPPAGREALHLSATLGGVSFCLHFKQGLSKIVHMRDRSTTAVRKAVSYVQSSAGDLSPGRGCREFQQSGGGAVHHAACGH